LRQRRFAIPNFQISEGEIVVGLAIFRPQARGFMISLDRFREAAGVKVRVTEFVMRVG
jgi:hypothetical protein